MFLKFKMITHEFYVYFVYFEGSAQSKLTGDILDVGTPFYQDGQLRVHVYWQRSTGMYSMKKMTYCSSSIIQY